MQLFRLHFSDTMKDVVAALSVYFNSVALCYFLEPCLRRTCEPTGNEKMVFRRGKRLFTTLADFKVEQLKNAGARNRKRSEH